MATCGCGRAATGNTLRCGRCAALHVLGLERDATSEEIRETYLTLVKVWHPDRFQEDERLRRRAGDKLAAINSAYQHLLKNQTRDSRPPGSSTASYDRDPTSGYAPNHRKQAVAPIRAKAGRGVNNVTIAVALLVCLLLAGTYIAKFPSRSATAEIIHASAYSSEANRFSRPYAEDQELHLVANLSGRGATSDGRTYSVALITSNQGKIPPETALFVQGVIRGQTGPYFIAISDEQDQHKTLLCSMTTKKFTDPSFPFQTGDRVQAYGIYAVAPSGIPTLQDCQLASPADLVVRPDGAQF